MKKDVINEMIGQKIIEIRVARGLTQQQLARKVGFTCQQVQKYEKGASMFAVDLWKLAQKLGVPFAFFFPTDVPRDIPTVMNLRLMREYNKLEPKLKKKFLAVMIAHNNKEVSNG
jgi:transcriptional regulator with XRE-family HTH domain